METYKRLNFIKELLKKYNSFIIYVLDYDSDTKEVIGYKTVTFKPVNYKKNGEIVTYPYETPDINNQKNDKIPYVNLMDSCRRILTLIRDNHELKIEKIYEGCKELSNTELLINWSLPPVIKKNNFLKETFKKIVSINDEENEKKDEKKLEKDKLERIIENVKTCVKKRKDEKYWDDDKFIWPKFIRDPNRKYVIKDVIYALTKDDLEFIKNIHKDAFYNDFLVSIKWNPIRLLGDDSYFSNSPMDDFGEYNKYNNALISCALSNSIKCMEYLLENGANPNYQNNEGLSALHIAAGLNYKDCVELLLKNNASKSLLNKNGLNPFTYAIKNNSHESAEIIKIDFNNRC